MSFVYVMCDNFMVVVYCIGSDDEVLEMVCELVVLFVCESIQCDCEWCLLLEELELFFCFGLWGIVVFCEYGGVGVLWVILVKVVVIVSVVDSFLGQILQNYFYVFEVLWVNGLLVQKGCLFGVVLVGECFGNVLVEIGMCIVSECCICLCVDGDGYCLDGCKFYCIGVFYVQWVLILVVDDEGCQ